MGMQNPAKCVLGCQAFPEGRALPDDNVVLEPL